MPELWARVHCARAYHTMKLTSDLMKLAPVSSMVPNTLVASAYLRRGLLLWLVTRAAITSVLLIAGADIRKFSTTALVEVVLLIVVLGWFEILRHRERTLLGNLGVSPLVISILFAVPAMLGEAMLRIGAAALA
jgi:hypothetical protein